MSRVVVDPKTAGTLIGLELVELAEGERFEAASDEETVVVVLGGRVDVEVNGKSLGVAGGRTNVFESAGYAVYAPPRSTVRLTAVEPASLAVAKAPVAGEVVAAPARVIGPADQRIAHVGKGNWARDVRTILGPEHAAGRILIGETINPPGNWSSYPPHKHDRQAPPDEVRLEEIYLFRVNPAGGFGVQVHYESGKNEAFTVANDEVAVIKSGYHPVVAAPGYELYYLWIMAGDGRQMIPHFDPAHAWVQEA